MTLSIASIVEGHGDVQAVPILIRRIARELDPAITVDCLPPLRVPRFKLVKPGELERSVELAARKTGGKGGILAIIDSEDDCPAELGPLLLSRAQASRNDLPIAVVLAKREFEAWFLAAAESLRGKRGLADDLVAPPDPEAVRGAKEWLSARMPSTMKYREVIDQPALTNQFDFLSARRTDSFDKCFRAVRHLLQAVCKMHGDNQGWPDETND